MNVIGGSDLIDDSHAAFRNRLERAAHFVLHHNPITLNSGSGGWRAKVGELHPVKGHLIPPALAPIGNHATKEFFVNTGSASVGIRLTLIPNRTFGSITRERGNHAIVDCRSKAGVLAGIGGLARTTRLLTLLLLLPFFHFGVESGFLLIEIFHDLLRVPSSFGLRPFLNDTLGLRECFQSLHAGERFHRLAAPGTFDNAHRHSEFGPQLLCEIITNCGKILGIVRLRRVPASAPIFLRLTLGDVGRNEDSEKRIFSSCNFFLSSITGRNTPFHIRLPRGEPNFSDQDVLDLFLTSVSFNGEGLAGIRGLESFEIHHPITRLARLGRESLASETDLDIGTRLGPTPDLGGVITLEDHAIRKELRDLEFSERRQ